MARPVTETRPLYTRVTDAIVADLERGVRPWTKPWASGAGGPVGRPLRHSGEPYRGINVLLLWAEAFERGYAAPTWMTFRQALALGGHVRKGEHGATVVYANRIVREDPDAPAGDDGLRSIPFLKAYTVFNVGQIDSLPAVYAPAPALAVSAERRIAAVEAFVASTGAAVRHGGDRAYYAPGPDYVQMPKLAAFPELEDYYATLLHELTHWTGHASRLDREFGAPRTGDNRYAREELVAELGAAFLCADLGVSLRPREDHASYLAGWLKVMKADHRSIFAAAAHAQRACDLLSGVATAEP
ncbi:ArdC family protein [Phenylobacterium sp.]|uniref:ArdC family protein n=1 Tax=Phenylobacterium sp. TaxID=1871053 RepID=UPI003563E3F3